MALQGRVQMGDVMNGPLGSTPDDAVIINNIIRTSVLCKHGIIWYSINVSQKASNEGGCCVCYGRASS